MTDSIHYGLLMHRAMQRLIADALAQVEAEGLPGEHHFYITFDTTHPDVALPGWMYDDYPDEMTIVMQNWFDALEVREHDFSVTLSFNGVAEALVIPFAAIRAFVDPAVQFELRLDTFDPGDEDEVPESPMIEIEDLEDDPAPKGDAEVVSLDSFRKR